MIWRTKGKITAGLRSKQAARGPKQPLGRKKRRKLTPLARAKKTLWELCKAITRARYRQPDGTWICYTSEKPIYLAKKVHTGHCIASALCSVEVRYDLKNLRPQSYNENINNSGNALQFERNLIRDYGEEYVNELWERNKATKGIQYPLSWYEERIRIYTLILDELK